MSIRENEEGGRRVWHAWGQMKEREKEEIKFE
jgi:hypothetical protein